jgi:predicted glycosyltransferase
MLHSLDLPLGRLILCMVGGGQDGEQLAEAFVGLELPLHSRGVLVAGPFMPPDVLRRLRHRAFRSQRMRVLDFVHEPDALVARADRVITMGGYNSICSSLSFAKRTLVVPRVRPRREQAIRAERLRELGLVDVLSSDDISSQRIAEWLAADLPPPETNGRIDLSGLGRLPGLLRDVLSGNSHKRAMQLDRKDVRNAAG